MKGNNSLLGVAIFLLSSICTLPLTAQDTYSALERAAEALFPTPKEVFIQRNIVSVPRNIPSYMLAEGPTLQLPIQRVSDMAFFCRMEVRMSRSARIPVKFRLGEVQYTERLEGKY